jgi:hypothetical protein
MDKGCITIVVPTHANISRIRNEFNKSEYAQLYKLNILISGQEDYVSNLGAFLMSKLK